MNGQSHVVILIGFGKADPKGIYGERFRVDDDLVIKIVWLTFYKYKKGRTFLGVSNIIV